MLCKPVRYAGTLLGMLCTRCFSFFFSFFCFCFFWGWFWWRKRKKKGKGKEKGKKREEEDFDYRRTLVVACLILQKRKPKSLFSYSRYLLYNVSSYTHTHLFFSFFKFFLVHFWGCFFLVFNCFRFRAPHSHGPTHPSPGKKKERERDRFFPDSVSP